MLVTPYKMQKLLVGAPCHASDASNILYINSGPPMAFSVATETPPGAPLLKAPKLLEVNDRNRKNCKFVVDVFHMCSTVHIDQRHIKQKNKTNPKKKKAYFKKMIC